MPPKPKTNDKDDKQGEPNAEPVDDRPAEERPGTPEHLGSDRPYEADPTAS